MLRLKKTRLSATFFATLLFASVAIFALAPIVKADEYQGGYTENQVISGKILDHQLYYFLLSCFYTVNMDSMDDAELESWEWLDNGNDNINQVRGGMYTDVAPECDDGNRMTEAWGRFGFTNQYDTFCALSFTYNVRFGGNGKDGTAGNNEAACLAGRDKDTEWDGADGSNFRTTQRDAVKALLDSTPKGKAAQSFTDAQRYMRAYRTFMNACSIQLVSEYDQSADEAKDDPLKYKVAVVTVEGVNQVKTINWLGVADKTDVAEYIAGGGVGMPDWWYDTVNRGGSDGRIAWGADSFKAPLVATTSGGIQWRTCGELATDTRTYAPAYMEYLRDHPDESVTSEAPDTTGAAGDNSIDAQCGGFQWQDLLTFGLSWVMCPLIEGAVATANEMEEVIAGMLCINESQIFSTSMTCGGEQGSSDSRDAFRSAWGVFRVLALGLLAIAGLVMIISQGLGFEVFDAYTIKKTLPRILIAGVAISLSWQLLEFVVTFSNALGIGIRSLIYQPFTSSGIDSVVMEGGSKAIGLLFGAAGLVSLGVFGLLSFILTAFLAILIAFFILVVRNILVIFLVIVAPVAIAMYILPNTEKYYKIWWDWFFKALLAFPIITALIAVGHVFAAITSRQSDSTLNAIVAFIAYFAPYFLIPAAFRMAGGALATISGFANDRSRGGFDRLKKYRSDKAEKRLGHYGGLASGRALQTRYKAYNALQGKKGVGSKMARAAIGGFNIESEMSAYNAKYGKMISDQTATGPDGLVRAYTVNKSTASIANGRKREVTDSAGRVTGHEYKTLGGAWVSETQVDDANRAFGKNNHAAFQQALTYEMGKALTQEDQDGLISGYADVAQGRFGMSNSQLSDVWIGSAYAKQNENRQWKHYKWDTDESGATTPRMNGLGMMREIDEKQGSYAMMQQNADTWSTMSDEMIKARQVVNGQVAGDRAQAEEILRRGARIAATTESGAITGSDILDQDQQPTGTKIGGRSVGAGAPGHVMDRMQAFVQIARREAGPEFQYRAPEDRVTPQEEAARKQYRKDNPAPVPEQDLNKRSR